MSINQVNSSARQVPNTAADTDRKQPEFLFGDRGRSIPIPGIGPVNVPSYGGSRGIPDIGLGGSTGAGGLNGRYIPGLDDTFVPNPGHEIPNPFRGHIPKAENAP